MIDILFCKATDVKFKIGSEVRLDPFLRTRRMVKIRTGHFIF